MQPRGAVAGTFLAGEMRAGEIVWPFARAQLTLVPKSPSYISAPFVSLSFARPTLQLTSRETTIATRWATAFDQPLLHLLPGEPVLDLPPVAVLLRPALELVGGSFVLLLDQTLTVNRPWLELTGRVVFSGKPGLTPTVPVDWVLVPTVPAEGLLTPSPVEGEEGDWLLRPTREVPA